MNPEAISSSSNSLMTNAKMSRPALSWCSKCGQSMEISSESNLYKSKTNFKFRKIFDLENSEVLIKTFSCALVDDILFQGTLYTSQNHFCFFSRIANKHKKIIISISQVVEITKEKTAGIFPNAIAIKTQHNRHLFASFVYREIAFRCLNEVWGAHHPEKFTAAWGMAFNDELCSKENPLLDIEVEADPLLTPVLLDDGILTTNGLIEDIPLNPYCLEIDESTDIDVGGLSKPVRAIFKSQGAPRRLSNQSTTTQIIPDHRNDSSIPFPRLLIGNALDFISRNNMQLTFSVLIIIFLILYIIILAWKIHNLQLILLEQFLSSKSIADDDKYNNEEIICSIVDENCKRYKESVMSHQSRMFKVQSDLKETLSLLQAVVDISGQMFGRLKTTVLPSITPSDNSPDEV